MLVVLGLLAATMLVGVAPADAAGCHFVDGTFVDSGASSASVWLDYCADGTYQVSGTLYDDACDERPAHLEVHASTGTVDHAEVAGCGNSQPYSFRHTGVITYVSVRTLAFTDDTASSSDWGHVYT